MLCAIYCTLDIAVRVESMARHMYLHRPEMLHMTFSLRFCLIPTYQ
jgi:hypothetical protein